MKNITLFGIFITTLFLLLTPAISSTYTQKNMVEMNNLSNTEGKALFAAIYVELDPESQQVLDILDNYHAVPRGFLTNITITIPDPNDEDGEWFMIAPFFRTLIGQWIGIGPFFDIISPTETTTVHIPILWGDVHFVDWPPEEDKPDNLPQESSSDVSSSVVSSSVVSSSEGSSFPG